MRPTRPNFTCNFAVASGPQRESAEVFNYIYPVGPVGRILTGNHSDSSYELRPAAIDIVCAPWQLTGPEYRMQSQEQGDQMKLFDERIVASLPLHAISQN